MEMLLQKMYGQCSTKPNKTLSFQPCRIILFDFIILHLDCVTTQLKKHGIIGLKFVGQT